MEDILDKGEGYASIPSSIKPDYFTQAVADNSDYGQENASQHITDMILVQYQSGSFATNNTINLTIEAINKKS